MIIAANKADIASAEAIEKLRATGYPIVPTSAEYELALRRAAKAGLISYTPGDDSFEVNDRSKLNASQLEALDKMARWLKSSGGTGVQKVLEKAVFEVLNMLIAYPVEDEAKWTDKKGRVLPDAYLMVRGSTAKDLAYKVHTDLGDNFIRAIDERTHMTVGHDHVLKENDVVKIVSRV